MRDVEAFRARHDPLAPFIAGHVPLVFPFASTLSALQIATQVRRVTRRWPALPVDFGGVDAYAAQWIHRRVRRGRQALAELHDRLYQGVLAPFLRHDLPYEPHLTIARAADFAICTVILRAAAQHVHAPIEATVQAIEVIDLCADGPVDRVREIPLGGTRQCDFAYLRRDTRRISAASGRWRRRAASGVLFLSCALAGQDPLPRTHWRSRCRVACQRGRGTISNNPRWR